MKALHPTRTHGLVVLSGPWSFQLGKLGRWLTSFFNVSAVFKANSQQRRQQDVCVCVLRASVSPAQCRTVWLLVCVRVTELNYRCRELAPRSRLDGILCDFCRKLISLRLALAFSYTPTHTHSVAHWQRLLTITQTCVCNCQSSHAQPFPVVFTFNFVEKRKFAAFRHFKWPLKHCTKLQQWLCNAFAVSSHLQIIKL